MPPDFFQDFDSPTVEEITLARNSNLVKAHLVPVLELPKLRSFKMAVEKFKGDGNGLDNILPAIRKQFSPYGKPETEETSR